MLTPNLADAGLWWAGGDPRVRFLPCRWRRPCWAPPVGALSSWKPAARRRARGDLKGLHVGGEPRLSDQAKIRLRHEERK